MNMAEMTDGASPVVSPSGMYGRDDVCRIADVSERQLRSWEKQKLVEPRETFGFSDSTLR